MNPLVSNKDSHEQRTNTTEEPAVTAAVKQFEVWIEEQPFRAGTIRVYKAIWGKFVRKMIGEGRDLAKLRPDQVRIFLETLSYGKKNEGPKQTDAIPQGERTSTESRAAVVRKNVKRQQRERYAFMIERALLALMPPESATTMLLRTGLGWGGASEARWRDVPSNSEFRVLPGHKRQLLRERLSAEAGPLLDKLDSLTPREWRRLRDTAILAILYGAGLKAGEIPWLSVNCIKYAPDVGVAAIDTHEYNGLGPNDKALANEAKSENKPHADAVHAHVGEGRGAHRVVPVMAWVMEILSPWAEHVSATYLPPKGEHVRLFPVGPTYLGSRLSFMNPSTLARIVGKWWPVEKPDSKPDLELTAQILRNSFAGDLIDAGVGLDDMETLMGYAAGSSGAFRLREVYVSRTSNPQLTLFK
jgi:integrase